MRADGAKEIVEQFQQNQATEQYLGRLWIRNLFRNYLRIDGAPAAKSESNKSQVYSYADLSTELPVILIGAGISLEAEIEQISELASSYCLVAVDTALPILRAHGINPDLVVAMESQVYNMRDFISGIDSRTMIAMDITAHPSLLRVIHENPQPPTSALFSSQFTDISLLHLLSQHGLRPLTIPALGSVGVAALYLALMLTTREIYIVGLDFNYTMGKTHCRGAPFISSALSTTTLLNPDPIYQFCIKRTPLTKRNKNGSNSRTEPPLVNSNRLLRALCAHYRRIYDCGNEGLYMSEQRARLSEIPRKITPLKHWPGPTGMRNAKATTNAKITFNSNASRISYASAARIFITSLRSKIRAFLSLNAQQYSKLFLDRAAFPTDKEAPQFAGLDFLSLDHRDTMPHAQHCRYSALDYYRRLTRYL